MAAHKYLLKEYGSWGVMTLAYITGLVEAGQVRIESLAGFLALALLINSKQAATVWMRTATHERVAPAMIFGLHLLPASLLLYPLYVSYGLIELLPYGIIPAVYLLSLLFMGEHALITEALGFIVLSLPAVVAKAIVGGGLDWNLLLVVSVFFVAGVFRVRLQFKKILLHRMAMFFYVAAASVVYWAMDYRMVLLLPFIDNLIFALTLYRISLPATGWIEMAKGVLFLLLMTVFGYN